jgi:hypothetical protein
MLQFFRFVSSYNELAPEGEEIHIPLFNQGIMDYILSHPSITNPAPEFAADIAELRAYLEKYRAPLQDEADDDGYDSYSSGPGRHYDSDSE